MELIFNFQNLDRASVSVEGVFKVILLGPRILGQRTFPVNRDLILRSAPGIISSSIINQDKGDFPCIIGFVLCNRN